jgi:hypothetical protein
MGKKSSAPAKTSSPIPGASGAADRGAPASEADPKPEAQAASPNPTEDLPQSPEAIDAILNDLHGFITFGEQILRELASNPNYLAPNRGVIKLEEWLFYLTNHVFPELGPFQSSGGTIPLGLQDFVHGPRLSVILRYLDRQTVREAVQRLQSDVIELNKLDPLRDTPPAPRLNRRRPSPFVDEDESKESMKIQMRLDEERATKREALGRDIVTEFVTFLGWFRSLREKLAVRLHEGEESHGNISRRATVGVGGAADQRETERSPTTAASSPQPAQMTARMGVLQAKLGGDRPRWDNSKNPGKLWLGDVLVREVFSQACNIIRILEAFEEVRWRRKTINDPLPGKHDPVRLRQAVNQLNRGRKHKLIRFGTTLGTKAVTWELV